MNAEHAYITGYFLLTDVDFLCAIFLNNAYFICKMLVFTALLDLFSFSNCKILHAVDVLDIE